MLVHEEHSSGSEPLDVDLNEVLTFHPPALKANVKVGYFKFKARLELLRLNTTFDGAPAVPAEWRWDEDRLPEDLGGAGFFQLCPIYTIAVAAIGFFAIVAVLRICSGRSTQRQPIENVEFVRPAMKEAHARKTTGHEAGLGDQTIQEAEIGSSTGQEAEIGSPTGQEADTRRLTGQETVNREFPVHSPNDFQSIRSSPSQQKIWNK